jgi:hypothetical protein
MPICPLVAGLPVEQGEAVLTRLSRIVAAAHAPLGSRTCKPNFRVVFTSDPQKLLKAWRHLDRFMYGPIPPPNGEQPIEQFIHSTRPIRVWYNTALTGSAGEESKDATFATGRNFEGAPAVATTMSPLMSWAALLRIASVVIVVDAQRVDGYTIGQVTDYVGMIGLTQVNQDSHPAAPSILRLFAESSATPGNPTELSTWDEAFLKGLYVTDQGSLWQRGQIITQVVKELVP